MAGLFCFLAGCAGQIAPFTKKSAATIQFICLGKDNLRVSALHNNSDTTAEMSDTIQQGFAALPEALQQDMRTAFEQWLDKADAAQLPEQVENTLPGVFACSEFVARHLAREPDHLTGLAHTGDLLEAYSPDEYEKEIKAHLEDLNDEQALMRHLRHLRTREMIRIIWRDLAGWAELDETMRELSWLADACVDGALDKLYRWACEESGTPSDSEGNPQQLVVIAMGKLGAAELNLSSDIDLIFAYPEEGETRDGPRPLSNAQFFTRLGQRLIKVLNEQTPDGFVFRVDMRLRPFGDSGALAASFDALEDYYQIHGREWERYALIKARVIAGDRQAGQQLMDLLRPFVYRRYLDYGAYESLREMKSLISREVRRKGREHDIKLGAGGIREIEFIAQVFQLIRGGQEPQLQARDVFTVLDYLQQMQLLPEYVVSQLKEAYVFLRRSEHRLQAYADQQTQVLPAEDTARLRLAWSMGYGDWETYIKVLNRHRARVQRHFEQVFEAPQAEEDESNAWTVSPLWSDGIGDEDARERLATLGFDDTEGLWQRLRALHRGRVYHNLSAQGRKRMDRLMPLFIGAAAETDAPDTALLRGLDLLEQVARRTVYLALLIENPMALSQLMRLCAASPWIARYLRQHPLLLDELLDAGELYRPPDKDALAATLRQRLASLPADDEERAMDTLRHFKQAEVLRVAAADIVGALPLMKVSDHLSWIAEVVLEETLNLAWQHLIAKHGRPVCTPDGQVCDTGFAVVAYGKLGGLELGYGSDLDVVFIHGGTQESLETQGERPVPLSVFFARLGQRMIHILTAHTPAGVLYEADMRLRPEGGAGMLVSGLEAFISYQQQKAWTWEHQALVRARVVAGDPVIAEKFEAIRRQVLGQARDREALRREVIDMRDKMRKSQGKIKAGEFDLKHSPGGIVDIEFMVQYGVLAWAKEFPALLDFTDNVRLLERLAEAGVMPRADAEFLSDAYRTYRDRLHRLTLQEQSAVVPEQDVAEQREEVLAVWSRWLDTQQRYNER
jgi:glutamate-ammonia-ligase adenylyltransferase